MDETETSSASPDGWVSIQDNTLQIGNPQAEGRAARICADETVSVFVNDLPIHTPTDVYATTHIRIQLPFRTYPEYDCEFEVGPQRCSLDLTVHERVPGCFYTLPDTPPSPSLLIHAEARPAPLAAFGEDILGEILHELKARGITTGILPERIAEAIATPERPHRIAETDPPVAPINRLEYLFPLPQPDSRQPEGFTLGFPILQRCRAGEVLVRRVREDLSRPGVSIYGETLPPPPPQPAPLKAPPDRTVIVDPEECQATARLEGIPSFNGREARIGALDRRSGPIEGGPGAMYDIKGSLQIDGSVLNQAQLWSTQHIEISGDVSHSHLEAQEHLIVHGNTIRSQLSAGGDAAARMRLREPVSRLLAQLEQVLIYVRDVRQILPPNRKLDDKQIFLRVIKTQFPHLPAEFESLWSLNQSLHQLHPRRTMVLKVVLANLLNLAERSMDEHSFIDWLDKLRSFQEDLLQLEPLKTHVYLNYLQGSTVVSRGSIFVLGEGCYNSELQAGGDILFCGRPGYCREGSIQVAGQLYVPELGSPNGSRLKVRLARDSRLRAQRIFPGVELTFGEDLQKHVLEPHQQVEVCVRQDVIVFKPWHPDGGP